MVPLPVGVAVPLALVAVEEAVELMDLVNFNGAHNTLAYTFVTNTLSLSAAPLRETDTKCRAEKVTNHFVQQQCNLLSRTSETPQQR